jgi:cytochrome c biogenesis protein CcdA
MLRLIGLMISIGLADSLNPTTIAPALYLASEKRPRTKVLEFTIGVFAVYLVGGALIALGPGQLIRSLVPHPHRTARQIGEIVAGLLLIAGAVILWVRRERLTQRGLPKVDPTKRSSAVLGATITAVELPTAFPYFAAIAAIVGSGLDVGRQFGLLILFNVCFVLPLLGIIALLTWAPDRSQLVMARARSFLERRWPNVLAILIFIVGIIALLLGVTGFAANARTGTGRFFQRFRRILRLHP